MAPPPPADGSNTVSAFVSTLVPVLLVSGIFFFVFLFLRPKLQRMYEPRTFMLREQERSPKLSGSLFGWIPEMMKMSDTHVLNHHSIDGYLLLRFLKISVIICFVGCCITWPVLFPVNATGGGGYKQLSLLSYQNINVYPNQPRLYAHTFIAWIYFGFIWFMIARETIYYINLRQAYLLSPLYANRISSRTVIYSSVPNEMLDGAKIRRLFGAQLKNYWIATDCKELQKLVEERDKVALQLEGAENKLIKLANDARLKSVKKGGASHEEENASAAVNPDGESGSAAARWVATKDRPTHRLKLLIGKKVDTINWCRQELERLIPEVEALQAKHKAGDAKFINAIIVEFHSQSDAQSAYQTTTHHAPLHMAPRYIGVNPETVIWNNLRILWWERVVRNAATIAAVCVLIVFWAIPVAFVGFLSNIDGLIHGSPGHPPIAPWLGFLNKLPPAIFGLVKGLLPSVLLAVLMALLPIFLRLMAKVGGAISKAEVELTTQNFYYGFQVVQVFLVTTLGSTATQVIQQIANDPGSTPKVLAQSIPSAANFYISYFIVQGLTVASGTLLQLVGIILFRVLGALLDKTPRKMYKRWISLSGLGWGTVFPVYSLLTSIAIIYSCLTPLQLGFATIGLYLFYLANRYNMLFVYDASQIDCKGLVYPRALQHITVGIYIGLLVMIGIFAVSECAGPTVLMVFFLIASILFHVSFRNAVRPLLDTLPRDLEVAEEDHVAEEAAAAAAAAAAESKNGASDKGAIPLPPAQDKPSMFAKWLHPQKYCDYATLRRMVPRDFVQIEYASEIESHAYYNPAIASPPPTLWVVHDEMGVSTQEVAHTGKIIPITDSGATFNDKGKITWDHDDLKSMPVWEDKVYY